jgi:hypothetical protein
MGIRIEEWPDDKIKAMHRHFLEVHSLFDLLLPLYCRERTNAVSARPQIKRRNEHDKTVQSS